MGLKRTPLYPLYAEHGAKTVNFGGWEMPVQFSGIIQEHETVRTKAGIFDVSHMGEIVVRGSDADRYLQYVTTNDIATLGEGQAHYSFLCNPEGGVVDDLIVYKLKEKEYMLVVNAANVTKDLEWLEQHKKGDVEIIDISEETALLALQGPLALRILQKLTDADLESLESFHFLSDVDIRIETRDQDTPGTGENTTTSEKTTIKALVSRTGYTGEDGFELYVPAEHAIGLWKGLMKAGENEGIIPVGLGARDTLRFEAKLPLYGQELSPQISPLEVGLGWFVKLDKGDFIGREALRKQKEAGVSRKLVGIEMIDRGIPRSHYPVYDAEDRKVGEVTSGTFSPTLKKNVGLALVDKSVSAIGTELWVEIRGKKLRAAVVQTPFYKRANN